jgi:hypothetical protein
MEAIHNIYIAQRASFGIQEAYNLREIWFVRKFPETPTASHLKVSRHNDV